MDEEKKYQIVRYFKTGYKKVLYRNVTLAIAKLHCTYPGTKTDKYFDGFMEIK